MPVASTAIKTSPHVTNVGLGGGVLWTGPGNASTSDDNKASAQPGAGQSTQYLWADQFNFNIPNEATPLGIEVFLERQQFYTTNYIQSGVVTAFTSIFDIGQNKASGTGFWNNLADETITHGNALDLWGLTPSAVDVNGGGMGCAVVAQNVSNTSNPPGGTTTCYVDSLRMRVTYISRSPVRMMV